MSTSEDIAAKYFDDAVRLAPLEVATAFTIGACLMSYDVGSSAWLHWLAQPTRTSWYFLDVVLAQKTWAVVATLACALAGPEIVKSVIRKLLKVATSSLEETVGKAYNQAREIAKTRTNGDLNSAAIDAWKKRKTSRFTRAIRLTSFAASLSTVSILVAATNHTLVDSGIAASLSLLTLVMTWRSFQLYISTHLADQILSDAALGLPRFSLTGWEVGGQ